MTEPDLFPTLTVRDVKLDHKIDELRRELKMRERLYPRWVEQGKLNAATADIRIITLRAILNDYLKQRKLQGEQHHGNEEKPGREDTRYGR